MKGEMKMLTCVDKRNKLREEFDRMIEKHSTDELSSPAIVDAARKLEKRLSEFNRL